MDYLLTSEQYAHIYGCTSRSITSYQRAAAPLDDPEAMYDWLWKRRTQPAGFTAKSKEQIVTAYARATAVGAESEPFLRKEVLDLLREIELNSTLIICKLLSAAQDGYQPDYNAALRAAVGAMGAALEEAAAAFGLDRDDLHFGRYSKSGRPTPAGDGDDDEPDEDEDGDGEPAANIVPLPAQSTTGASAAAASLLQPSRRAN